MNEYERLETKVTKPASLNEAIMLLKTPCYETNNFYAPTSLQIALDVIKELLYQFAFKGTKQGQPILQTGGLSALERAFEFVGWDDPCFMPEVEG